MEDIWVLHTMPHASYPNKIYAVATGEHGRARLDMETAKYSAYEQSIMTISGPHRPLQ